MDGPDSMAANKQRLWVRIAFAMGGAVLLAFAWTFPRSSAVSGQLELRFLDAQLDLELDLPYEYDPVSMGPAQDAEVESIEFEALSPAPGDARGLMDVRFGLGPEGELSWAELQDENPGRLASVYVVIGDQRVFAGLVSIPTTPSEWLDVSPPGDEGRRVARAQALWALGRE